MMHKPTQILLLSITILAAGTYVLRYAGIFLRDKISQLSPKVEIISSAAAIMLLVGVITTNTVADEHTFAGISRITAVSIGGLLAYKKAPFIITITTAATTAALLRHFLHIP